MVSYGIAALAALLSGLAYAEFAVDLPVAGGATTCILLSFGELASWWVLSLLPTLAVSLQLPIARTLHGHHRMMIRWSHGV